MRRRDQAPGVALDQHALVLGHRGQKAFLQIDQQEPGVPAVTEPGAVGRDAFNCRHPLIPGTR
jgi:hypothetical protein